MNLQNKFFLILSVFLLSCSNNNTKNLFIDYLKDNNIPFVKTYIIISEDHCFSCNKSFYELSKEYINNSNAMFIITSDGGLLDTRIYENKRNVYWDYNKEIQKLNIIRTSGIILLKNKSELDTIIAITPTNIDSTIEYIKKVHYNVQNQ